jgi:hypothetical protein
VRSRPIAARLGDYRVKAAVRPCRRKRLFDGAIDPLLPFVVASPTSAVQRVRSFAATA